MKNIFAGAVIFFIFFIIIKNFSYNKKQELIFKIDYYSQSEQWVDVLKTAKKYPGNNQLVIYYTNLALAQQKQLSERLFSFSQIGEKGFRLKWERNQIASFYGGDVFFYLQNHNEAFRWAFESIVSIGVNPKGLKRLVETSIATNHLELAEKYLGIIEESLFYRAWANQKKKELNQIRKKRFNDTENYNCVINTNFISDIVGYDLMAEKLIENCPENDIAFEFHLASLLINKNINAIWELAGKLNKYSYLEIPIHIEEALLIYMNNNQKQLNTDLKIRDKTLERFEHFAYSFAKNINKSDKLLKKEYGTTFWYYYYFN